MKYINSKYFPSFTRKRSPFLFFIGNPFKSYSWPKKIQLEISPQKYPLRSRSWEELKKTFSSWVLLKITGTTTQLVIPKFLLLMRFKVKTRPSKKLKIYIPITHILTSLPILTDVLAYGCEALFNPFKELYDWPSEISSYIKFAKRLLPRLNKTIKFKANWYNITQ